MLFRRPTVFFADTDALAPEALYTLARQGASLVLCSSETRAEIELRQRDLEISDPLVCENGSAAVIPVGYFAFDVPHARPIGGYQAVEFGRAYGEVAQTVHRAAGRLRIDVAAFSHMSVEEVARDCNLPLLRARLAKLREYQEVFRLCDPTPQARNRLRKELRLARLRCIERGRFDHAGSTVSVVQAVGLLARFYRRAWRSLSIVGVALEPRNRSLHRLLDASLNLSRDPIQFHARGGPAAMTYLAERLTAVSRSTGSATPPAAPDFEPARDRLRVRR